MLEDFKEGIALEDILTINREMLSADLDCRVVNAVRRGYSRVKGGGLLSLLKARRVITVVVSDDVRSIGTSECVAHVASGPTWTGAYNLSAQKVRRELERVGIKAPPYLTDIRPSLCAYSEAIVVADNGTLLSCAKRNLERAGYDVHELPQPYLSSSGLVAEELMAEFSRLLQRGGRSALLAGGESTVKVNGNGLGGRMQELMANILLRREELPGMAAIGVASDGDDSLLNVAGAYISPVVSGLQALDVKRCLAENNTYALHKRLNTCFSLKERINVGDMVILAHTGEEPL